MRVAGIMSGTSLDGIDVAIVDVTRRSVRTVGFATFPYSHAVRTRILAVSDAACSTAAISRLNFELAELYAKAVRRTSAKSGIPLESIELIGCHGQTIYHEGQVYSKNRRKPNTLQIGEPAVLAERLSIPVVSNFRARDVAAGGQGAPLVPFVDYLLFRSAKVHRVALNMGGIANITVLPRRAAPQDVIAFDTGPGNMVIDQLAARMTSGVQRFDHNGEIAARGRVKIALLKSLLRDKYFAAPPPKSTGREHYGTAFVEKLVATGFAYEDLIATATAFTAASIAEAVGRFGPATREVIASGGGVHNPMLMGQLAALLPQARITTTEEFGVDPDAKEAVAFAILAWRSSRGKTGNLPAATGARRAVILGAITPL